ncbi:MULTISPECIES: PaaI family thioesterase [Brevundimonas]|uniref:Thioesterase domain-containing protein n=1 Tax=Brevundimonas mediterranea TaxID=74329 RepID=A0A7Z8Y0T2_9CAUL|nr:PaaI family thioesterase [Brevundimonas mediterranea]VDC48757.1 hypothetical protein BREV_BREV_03293 [Brevundimonas mediterranea]
MDELQSPPPPLDDASGLEFLRAGLEGRLPLSSIFGTMGMSILELDAGRVVFGACADGRHLNPMGGVHGGFAATVLDSVTGCAVHTRLDAGVRYATVDLAIKMLRPIPQNVNLIAEGRLTHLSRSLGVAEGEVRAPDGKLLASGTATCFIIRS